MERNSTIAAWRLYGFIEQTIDPTFSPEYRRWLMELAGGDLQAPRPRGRPPKQKQMAGKSVPN